MDSTLIKILAAAGVSSTAAISAPAINKFRNVPAGICALLGAVLPWLLFAMPYLWPISNSLGIVGLASIASSFLFALFFYSVEEASTTRTIALGLITVAICALLYPCVLITYGILLSGL